MRSFLVVLFSLFAQLSIASPVPKNGFTEQQFAEMALANEQAQFLDSLVANSTDRNNTLLTKTDVRAFAEYESAGYLIFSSTFAFDSKQAKLEMARNLPEGVKLVVYTGSTSTLAAQELKDLFSQVLHKDRIFVVYMPDADRGFWARDGVPVPVIRHPKIGGDEFLSLVNARYYHRFEPDAEFGELFSSELTDHEYYYEGGNFMANDKNQCLVINTKATAKVPDSVLEEHYGCKDLTRLPHVKGIGHADESVKFIDTNTVLTDEESYVPTLESKGFKVVRLPRPDRKYETYVNSLIVNGVVYVPIFNEFYDEEALQVYRDLGFKKVIGLDSVQLSNTGLGSLHCITMTYPEGPINRVLHSIGGQLLLQ